MIFEVRKPLAVFLVILSFVLIASFVLHDVLEHHHPDFLFDTASQMTILHSSDRSSQVILAYILAMAFLIFCFLAQKLIMLRQIFAREIRYLYDPQPLIFDKLKLAFSRGIIEPKIGF